MGFKIESGLLDACALAILEKGDTYGYDQSYQGRNRRYYSITDEGKAKLLDYRCQWMDHKNAIDVFLDVKRAKE